MTETTNDNWIYVCRRGQRGSEQPGFVPSGPEDDSVNQRATICTSPVEQSSSTQTESPIASTKKTTLSGRQRAIAILSACRQKSKDETMNACQRLHRVTKGDIQHMVLTNYKFYLSQANKVDKARKKYVDRISSEVSSALLTSTDVQVINTMERTIQYDAPESRESSSQPQFTKKWDEPISSQYLNSDAIEKRKILLWPKSRLTVSDCLALLEKATDFNMEKLCMIRKQGRRRRQRLELFFSNQHLRDEALWALKRNPCALWEARPGRPYYLRRRDQQSYGQSNNCSQEQATFQLPLQNSFTGLPIEDGESGVEQHPTHPSLNVGSSPHRHALKLKVGTLNVQGAEGKEVELLQLLKTEQLDILALTETWWVNSGKYICGIAGYQFFGNPARKLNTGGHNAGGVGVLVSTKYTARLEPGWEPGSNTLWVRLKMCKGKDVFICVVYGPQVKTKKATREEFYQQLLEETQRYQRRGPVIVLGDFNARVSKTHPKFNSVRMGRYTDSKSNANAELFLQWLNHSDMFVTNGRSNQHGLYTRIFNGTQSILDYIIVDSSLISHAMGARVLEDFDCGSDHRAVITSLQLVGKPQRHNKTIKRTRTWQLQDPETASTYQQLLSDRLRTWEALLPEVRHTTDSSGIEQHMNDIFKKIDQRWLK